MLVHWMCRRREVSRTVSWPRPLDASLRDGRLDSASISVRLCATRGTGSVPGADGVRTRTQSSRPDDRFLCLHHRHVLTARDSRVAGRARHACARRDLLEQTNSTALLTFSRRSLRGLRSQSLTARSGRGRGHSPKPREDANIHPSRTDEIFRYPAPSTSLVPLRGAARMLVSSLITPIGEDRAVLTVQ